MRVPRNIVVLISCCALIFGAAVNWQVLRLRVKDATVCRSRAEQGNAVAQTDLANRYYHGRGVPQDYAEALCWYRKATDQGTAKAENAMALMYSHGLGVSQDNAEALRWYRQATDQGYAKAQYNLGNILLRARGATEPCRGRAVVL